MSNIEKKLDALIDALGFDVETLIDTKETPISKQSGLNRITSGALTMTKSGLATDSTGTLKRGDDECYYLVASFDVDYKLTKRIDNLPLDCVVNFVLSHREDIINDINDYGGLGTMLDFIERESNN